MLREMNLDVKEYITNDYQGKKDIDNLFVYDAGTMEPLDVRQFQPDDDSGHLFNLSENDFEIIRDRDTVVFEAKVLTELFHFHGPAAFLLHSRTDTATGLRNGCLTWSCRESGLAVPAAITLT